MEATVESRRLWKVQDQRLQIMRGRAWQEPVFREILVDTDLVDVQRPRRIRCIHVTKEKVVVGRVTHIKTTQERVGYGYPQEYRTETKKVTEDLEVEITYEGQGTILVNAETKLVEQAVAPSWVGRSREEALRETVKQGVKDAKEAQKNSSVGYDKAIEELDAEYNRKLQKIEADYDERHGNAGNDLVVLKAFRG